MSLSSKKARQQRQWKDAIEVDEQNGPGVWLQWCYAGDLHVDIQLKADDGEDLQPEPWLYLDGGETPLCVGYEITLEEAEGRYGAMTRVHLMQQFADEIRDERTRARGIAKLERAATADGLLPKQPTPTGGGSKRQVACPGHRLA